MIKFEVMLFEVISMVTFLGANDRLMNGSKRSFVKSSILFFELTGKKTLKTDFRLTTKDLIRKKSKINLQC